MGGSIAFGDKNLYLSLLIIDYSHKTTYDYLIQAFINNFPKSVIL